MAYDVFISYSHVDKGFVTDFSGELDKIGVGYFLDEKELDWGSHINESIKSSLFESKCILVIISPASLKSEWVPFEIGYAIANGKKILPLLIHPSLDMPAYIKMGV